MKMYLFSMYFKQLHTEYAPMEIQPHRTCVLVATYQLAPQHQTLHSLLSALDVSHSLHNHHDHIVEHIFEALALSLGYLK